MSSFYYVNVYRKTKCYGGSEEGGWFYDCGTFVQNEGCYNNVTAAETKRQRLEKEHKYQPSTEHHMGHSHWDGLDPSGEPDDAYLQRGGRWGKEEIQILIEPHFGMDYPEEAPRYE